MDALGWDELDVLLITGDAYVDHYSFAMPLLARWLVSRGYRTGIVAQPKWDTVDDFMVMGRPRLFAGVSGGALDSLLAHYTAFRKKRHEDAYTPGGQAGARPNRASIVYTGLARQAFPGLPVLLGGIEASLRRASHYDFWSDSLRRSIVLDSKTDAVLYGMGERTILRTAELFADSVARQRPVESIARAGLRGAVYAIHPDAVPVGAEELPSHEAMVKEPSLLIKATLTFERQMLNGGPCLVQRSGGRAVVFEPPSEPLSPEEMDEVYDLPFTRKAHPSYSEPIPAVAMLESSITSHRGCGGGCAFCALASHQGRTIQSRSRRSVLSEVAKMAAASDWKGSISDIGGPTSNMWGAYCAGTAETCKRESCLFPRRCRHFKVAQGEQVELLRAAGDVGGVNHVRVASGVRHDLAMEDDAYMRALVGEFTGGQLKIAPEHVTEKVLRLMRKPPVKLWNQFIKQFQKISEEVGKDQYIVPYLMSAFPGSTDQDMAELAAYLEKRGWRPQQVQCFIPSPGTVATAMFFAGEDTEGRKIHVARTDAERLRQHRILMPDAEPSPVLESRPSGRRSYGQRDRRDRRDGDRPARPFRRDADGGGRSARPPREGGSFERKFSDKPNRPFRDKPFKRTEDGDRPSRPFRRDADGSGRSARPPREGGSFERKFSDKPNRPFRDKPFKRTEDGDRPARPFRRDADGGGRPARPPREGGSFERKFSDKPNRPFRDKPFKRTEDGDRPARPFRRDADGSGRPPGPPREGGSFGKRFDSKPRGPYRGKPGDRPGGGGGGRGRSDGGKPGGRPGGDRRDGGRP